LFSPDRAGILAAQRKDIAKAGNTIVMGASVVLKIIIYSIEKQMF